LLNGDVVTALAADAEARLMSAAAAFRRDPISYLRTEFRRQGGVFTLPDAVLCVADPAIAQEVLRDPEHHYGELSGFFQTSFGNLGPRTVQSTIGKQARQLLRPQIAEPATVRKALAPLGGEAAGWPAAGPVLAYEFFRQALLSEASPLHLHELLRSMVTDGMVMLTGPIPVRLRRSFLRQRMLRLVEREIGRRQSGARIDSVDLLDLLIQAAPEACAGAIAEIYLLLFRSVTSAVGFTLGWALWLAGRWERITDLPPAWVVKEGQRLFPTAWMFSRTGAREHTLGTRRVGVGDRVRVCPYLIHRHPQCWDEPDMFRPERWSGAPHYAFMPFGSGPFACTGASLVQAFAEAALHVFTEDLRFSVVRSGERPLVSALLVPPRFWLRLDPA
jgi:cytochrome P450